MYFVKDPRKFNAPKLSISIKFGYNFDKNKKIEIPWGYETSKVFSTSRDIKANFLLSPCATIFKLFKSTLGQLWNLSQR